MTSAFQTVTRSDSDGKIHVSLPPQLKGHEVRVVVSLNNPPVSAEERWQKLLALRGSCSDAPLQLDDNFGNDFPRDELI